MDPKTLKIKKALVVLFGKNLLLSQHTNNPIVKGNLKTTYRQKIKKNHPDKSKILGVDEKVLTYRFQKVNQAYNFLLNILDYKKQIVIKKVSKNYKVDSKSNKYRKEFMNRYYKGNLPKRELRFGEYLFYNNIINFGELIDAISWQRGERPRIGEIGIDKGYLSRQNISHILRNKNTGELFGKAAHRLGLLSSYELYVLLGNQKRYKCNIGQYFLKENMLKEDELNHLLQHQKKHNLRIKSGRY